MDLLSTMILTIGLRALVMSHSLLNSSPASSSPSSRFGYKNLDGIVGIERFCSLTSFSVYQRICLYILSRCFCLARVASLGLRMRKEKLGAMQSAVRFVGYVESSWKINSYPPL